MQKSVLELCEFLSVLLKNNESIITQVCIQVVDHAGKIISGIKKDNTMNVKLKGNLINLLDSKGPDDPYTQADVKVQTLIIKTLRYNWPSIKIVGEEEEEFEGDIGIDFKSFKKNIVSKDLFKNFDQYQLNLDECIVWVDPLDGTIDFVNGQMDSVTTLIGISVNQTAKVGVIGKYYNSVQKNGNYEWDPRCYFSHADYPAIYYYNYLSNTIEQMLPSKYENRLIVGSTKNHLTPEVQDSLNKVKADKIMHLGGSGNKILCIIEGLIDNLCYPVKGTKRWDICPGDALLKSVGGKLTNKFGQPYAYTIEKDTWMCSEGLIASLSPETHDKVIERLNSQH